MAIILDTLEIRGKSPSNTVETTLTQLNLWSVVTKAFEPMTHAQIQSVLSVPVKDGYGRSRVGAWYPDARIIYLSKGLQDNDIVETFLHELAHCIVDTRLNITDTEQEKRWPKHLRLESHGVEWQWTMRKLGQVPNRCHNIAYLRKR